MSATGPGLTVTSVASDSANGEEAAGNLHLVGRTLRSRSVDSAVTAPTEESAIKIVAYLGISPTARWTFSAYPFSGSSCSHVEGEFAFSDR